MNKGRIYSFEQLCNLVGKDIALEDGEHNANLKITGEGNKLRYNFTFSEPKDDALVEVDE